MNLRLDPPAASVVVAGLLRSGEPSVLARPPLGLVPIREPARGG